MANAPARTPALGDRGYRAYLEELLRKGDDTALEAELAKAQLTREQLDALVAANSGAVDWSDSDVDLFAPTDSNGSPDGGDPGPQLPSRQDDAQRP